MTTTLLCSCCQRRLPIEAFHMRHKPRVSRKVQNYCRQCAAAYSRTWRARRDRVAWNLYQRAYRAARRSMPKPQQEAQ